MKSLLNNRRRCLVAVAALLAVSTFTTPAWSQASITYTSSNAYITSVSADGLVVAGSELNPDTFGFTSFVIKNNVKIPLTIGGSYGFPAGVSADGSTVVGYEYDFSFTPYLWIWHDGDAEASPLHPEIIGTAWGLSADGSTVIGARQDGPDSHAFPSVYHGR